jgi:Ca-activated chloride channel family protein
MRTFASFTLLLSFGVGLYACGSSDSTGVAGRSAPVGGYDAGVAYTPPIEARSDAGAPADLPSFADASTSPADVPAPSADVPAPPVDAGEAPVDAGAPGACAAIASREPVTLYLSADDSNSMASPVIARRMIRRGQRVPAGLLRTYEFLNYYNVPYEAAEADHVRVVPQMRPGAEAGSYELQVGVASERRGVTDLRPMTITFVLDTSGSMGEDQRIDRERAVVRAIAGSLRAGDIVSAVTWSTTQREVLSGYRVTRPDDPTLLALAATLSASGGTDLSGGLQAGYALAQRHYGEGRLNRVVVISDGMANVGVTDARVIAEAAHVAEREEIYLVGVGVGDGFNDTMMDTITDRGRGAYVFVDSDAEARAMFGARFTETMDLAVRAVRLELTLPWYLRVSEFHGEAISTDPREVDPQHLAPNDAMVFHQVIQACSASMVGLDDHIVARATYTTRARVPAAESVDLTVAQLLAGEDSALRRGRAIVAWAEALKHIAERPTDARALLDDAERVVRAAANGPDPALDEILDLIATYRTVSR